MLAFLPVENAELALQDRNLGIDGRDFFYEPTQTGVVHLERLITSSVLTICAKITHHDAKRSSADFLDSA